jgi:prepilin-type N-terminal cleavage/methylation domain-containing protein
MEMMRGTLTNRQRGFSLIEVMLVLVIFLIVSGAVFELLNASQIRYRAERDFLESFQGARLGVEIMVRDIHNAGYPPPYTFAGNLGAPPTPAAYPAPLVGPTCPPAGTWTDPACAPAALQTRFAMGILGLDAAGNVSTTCTVDTTNPTLSTCDIPNPWELVLELDIDPENPNPDATTGQTSQVEWVYYDLRAPVAPDVTSTLFRTVSPKQVGVSPTAAPSNVPFVEEIVQNPTGGAAAVTAANPAVFVYECDLDALVGPGVCLAENVKNVYINLRAQSTRPEIATGRMRQITVRGAGSRQYPNR